MTNSPGQLDFRALILRKDIRNIPLATQLPIFFGKRFLAAAKRVRANSKSSLPSQNSMTSLAKETKCSIWELKRRPRRRHISSSSARCSSDMRMLYRRFFFATDESCQSGEMNTWLKRVDNGRQETNLPFSAFPNVTENFWTGRPGGRQIFSRLNEFNESNCGRSGRDGFQKAIRDESFFPG